MFTFTPLLGALSPSPAVQSLLAFDESIKVLIDVGWDESFNTECFKELERQVPTISLILLTHATLSHLGAYLHCYKTIPLFSRIPVYATTPVISLGRALLQDLYESNPLASTTIPNASIPDLSHVFSGLQNSPKSAQILLPRPTDEEISTAFAAIKPLKYSQPHQPISSPFSPSLEGLTITAYSAGHTLGGTIWHIQHGSESVVYAVDWSHARENTLTGAAWLGGSATTGAEVIEELRQPTALICSSKGSGASSIAGGWKSRDELLMQHIISAIQRGGSVLIPCDTSARVLELAYLLEREWVRDSSPALRSAKLYLASRTCGAVMKHARSMLEWMNDAVVTEMEALSRNKQSQTMAKQPFEFEYLTLIERQSRLNRILARQGPKIFLASDSTLEWGFSQHILRNLAENDLNSLIIPFPPTGNNESQPGAVSPKDTLLQRLTSPAINGNGPISSRAVDLRTLVISGLESTELALYQQYLALQRQRVQAAITEKTSPETSADIIDDHSSSSSSSSDESDTQQQGKALHASSALNHAKRKVGLTDEELGVNILLRRKDVYDFDVRGKKGRDRMFPFVAKRRRNDEFGDIIRPDDYIRAEEKDSLDPQAAKALGSKDNVGLGQKRRWDSKEDQNGRSKSNTTQSPSKKQKTKAVANSKSGDRNMQNGNLDHDSDKSDDEPDPPMTLGPSKALLTSDTLNLRMRVSAIDYAGLHDKRALGMLVPLIRPQKLILTGGKRAETRSFAADCEQMLALPGSQANAAKSDQRIFTPENGEMIDASVDTNAWDITISQPLYKSLSWQQLRGLGIASVNGQVKAAGPGGAAHANIQPQQISEAESGESATKRQKVEQVEAAKKQSSTLEFSRLLQPLLDVLPISYALTARANAHSIHVGDLRLAELRRLLQNQGHTAEFKGEGSLLVDGLVVVRKSGIGQIEVEGMGLSFADASYGRPKATFTDVKRKIYDGLAVVSAR